MLDEVELEVVVDVRTELDEYEVDDEQVMHHIIDDEVEVHNIVVTIIIDGTDAKVSLLLDIQHLVDIMYLDELNILAEIILSIASHLAEL